MSHHSPTVRSGFQFSSSHALTSVRTSSGEGIVMVSEVTVRPWPDDMSDEERRAFLAPGTRTAKLAVTRHERRAARGADLVRARRRRRRLHHRRGHGEGEVDPARRPRVALCVDDDKPPFSFVMIEGTRP